MVKAMCGVQLKDIKITMFGLNEAMDQFSPANSVCLYGHVLS